MPNPLDMNRMKVVRVFDSACANLVRSLASNMICSLCYLRITYAAYCTALGLLHNKTVCL